VAALVASSGHLGVVGVRTAVAAQSPTPTPTATPVPERETQRVTQAAPRPAPQPLGTTAASRAAGVSAPGIGALTLDPIPSPLVVGASNSVTGSGFTAGSVIVMFIAASSGTTSAGPFVPTAQTPTSLTFSIPTSVPLGNGFGTLLIVNTDQGYISSNTRSQYIFGAAAQNIPTITGVNGVGLRPFSPTVPVASVDTALQAGMVMTISGTGFNNPRVNLFTPGATFGGLTPNAGGTATQIQVNVPAAAATGPATLQVVNSPFTGNVVSNAVSVVIGAGLTLTGVSQNGTTVTVMGSGFSSATVLNLFNAQGGIVANLGGLWVTNGRPRIPINLVSGNQLTFTVPPTALSGAAFLQLLNPPFMPFSTSGADPDGSFQLSVPTVARGGSSLRFFGNGSGDIDRVKLRLDGPARPVDVGANFTIEFWMKASANANGSGACVAGGDGWINGNIIVDRDVFGSGDFGDYGISLFGNGAGGGTLAFGVDRLGSGNTICGTTAVDNGAWHHVAVTRMHNGVTGELRIYVDGVLDASGSGPVGDVSYRNGRPTQFPNSDPFLVIGAEKHDAGEQFPSYVGRIDEMRISSTVRYSGSFTPPTSPFGTDVSTAALYHFDEGNGNLITDSASAAGGPSNGVRRFGGAPLGPHWSPDTPFTTGTPMIALEALPFGVSAPTGITHCGDNRLFIASQNGTIHIWDGTQLLGPPFLTVTPNTAGGEQGLLGLAFHPQYAQNGFFYVYHNATSSTTTVARYRVSSNPNIADPNSRVVLLTMPQPAGNHNGGALHFGADGYLYIGKGDGGGGCDNAAPGCNAQRNNSLLGKLLRIDVNQNVNTMPFYGIPPTNPFIGPDDPLDEIWAKGLRNPWRLTFDRLTGSLFIGDVGQNLREEVNYRPHDDPGGGNYGWKRMEGFACDTCSVANCPALPPCNDAAYILPVLDYLHAGGTCSITGGFVYRGTRIPFLYGRYLFGDLCNGMLVSTRDNEGVWSMGTFSTTAGGLYTFGEDVWGELYLGQGNGAIWRIVP